MPPLLTQNLERASGLDLSDVQVYRNSPQPALLDAEATAQGRQNHLGPGAEPYLPHEAWHVVQQMQGRVAARGDLNGININDDVDLEVEADRMGERLSHAAHHAGEPHRQVNEAGHTGASHTVQRKIRTGGGATKVQESDYLKGGSKSSVGTRYSVASLIRDSLKRVFLSTTELEDYANGKADYIGDVKTAPAGTFWYRLPATKLTVLGEVHENPKGNVEDVILGLQTSRFKYEPFNELADVLPFKQKDIGTSTKTRLAQVHKGKDIRVAGLVDRSKFNPDLENIVIKALTGAAITRNEYIPANPAGMSAADKKKWGKRSKTTDYSYGERVALYLSFAIHIAADIAQFAFGPEVLIESDYFQSARRLMEYYQKHKTTLDAFAAAKDGDNLVGMYELTSPGKFANLTVIEGFTKVFHEFGSRYIEGLGSQLGNKKLEAQGAALSGNLKAGLDDLSPAREEIMWQQIQVALAKKYLIVGMGDAHRKNLSSRLTKANIDHREVEQSLVEQKTDIDKNWVP
ncbi:hypothetical protein YTPLAS72_14230 [Nitrospira sp.]|nr:hypothetical protein YTPLAS72_14230 [Nitrospira sp.]